MLSLGVIDGRNIWRADLARAFALLEKAAAADRSRAAPGRASCSLLHCPIDLEAEDGWDGELRGWLAFARQKLGEIAMLTRGLNAGRGGDRRCPGREPGRAGAPRPVAADPSARGPAAAGGRGRGDAAARRGLSRAAEGSSRPALRLPLLPTTTIGSFPQTAEVRKARAALKKGDWTGGPVRGLLPPRRSSGPCGSRRRSTWTCWCTASASATTWWNISASSSKGSPSPRNGWVQSYGTRCVKPPIIYGDVCRPRPMTVAWSRYAQSLTRRPMKGMLTGPITILQWSFVRDDQPRRDTAMQIALAIRQEVADLEAAGIGVIQIDEPAPARGPAAGPRPVGRVPGLGGGRLPPGGLRRRRRTQIHTHMCYSEFNDIIEAIAALDADVISIEASRSDMELLDAFARFRYPNEIGPGRLRHSQSAGAGGRGDHRPAAEGPGAAAAGAALGESRLRAEDPRLARGAGLAAEHGRGGQEPPPRTSTEVAHRVEEDLQAVAHRAGLAAGPAGMLRGVDVPLGMRHQAEDAAAGVAQPGHVGHRAVGIVGKRKRPAAVALGDVTQHQLPGRIRVAPARAASRVMNLPSPWATGRYIDSMPRRKTHFWPVDAADAPSGPHSGPSR